MKKRIEKKGFTLIELLATIAIIGILMAATIGYALRLIQKARNESMEQQERIVSLAAESYFQANRDRLPKLIGQTTTIPIKTLLETNYLKKEIKNSKGETCMEKSFVTARKDSTTKYTYKAHLYCGNDVVPAGEKPPTPDIKIDFCHEVNGAYSCRDKDGDTGVTESVSDAFVSIIINGNQENEDKVKLEGYSWSISALYKDEQEEKEVYNSGTLSAKGQTSIKIPKANSKQKYILKNYIDVTAATKIIVKVSATNEKGGISEEKQAIITYKDNTRPVCGNIIGQAVNSTDWINKGSNRKRTITAECVDGTGSGCLRKNFTQTWPNQNQKALEYAYILVEDNAGNTNRPKEIITKNSCEMDISDNSDYCRVRVNIDLESPVITLNSANAIGKSENVLYTDITTTQNAQNDSATLKYNEYYNLYSSHTWMNQNNYPQGVIYTLTLSDNLRLANWKFETNAANLEMPGDGNPNSNNEYKNLSTTNADGVSVTTIDQTNACNNSKQIQVAFTNDGIRKGKLTVTDIAGNTATYIIEANLDRVKPNHPEVIMRKWNSNSDPTPNETADIDKDLKEVYTPGNWSNKHIYTRPKKVTDSISGIKEYQYTTTGATENKTEMAAKYRNVKAEGESEIEWRACDNAGNCSDWNQDKKIIKIDKTKPSIAFYMRTYTNQKPTTASEDDNQEIKYHGEDTNKNVFLYPETSDKLSGIASKKIANVTCSDKCNKDIEERIYPTITNKSYETYTNSNNSITSQGKYQVNIKVCDNAGNCNENIKYVNIDREKPKLKYVCLKLTRTSITPSIETLEGKNFTLDQKTKDYLKTLQTEGCGLQNSKPCNNAVIIKYNDNYSGDRVERKILLGDQDQIPNPNTNPANWEHANGKGTFKDGKYINSSSTIDRPGADDENIVLLADICDRAGNCAFPIRNNILTINCKNKINSRIYDVEDN